MRKEQADAIAKAMLTPSHLEQTASQDKEQRQTRHRAMVRFLGWFALPGVLVGGALAHFGNHRYLLYLEFGAVAGLVLGSVVLLVRNALHIRSSRRAE